MRKFLPVFILVVLFGTACASVTGGDPKSTVKDAFTALEDYEGVTWTLTVQSDPASMAAMSEGELNEQIAGQILDSSLVFSQVLADDPLKQHVDVTANVAGISDAFQMRFVDDTLFIRADVNGLVETFGGDPAQVQTFVQQAEASGLTFAGPAVQGEWLGIEGLSELAQQMGAPATPVERADAEAFRALGEAIEEDAEVEEVGDDEAGTHYEVRMSVRSLFERLKTFIEEVGASSGLPAGSMPDSSQIPDEDFVLDVWVDDGALSQVEIDFLKLEELADEEIPEGVERFAIRLGIAEFTGSVEPPSDFVAINPQQIMQALFGATMGTESAQPATSGSENVDCEMVATMEKDVQAMFAEECPELQG